MSTLTRINGYIAQYFPTSNDGEKLPPTDKDKDEELYHPPRGLMVIRSKKDGTPLRAIFQCPCGCGTVMDLTIRDEAQVAQAQASTPSKRSWVLEVEGDAPSLSPDISAVSMCRSKFRIRDGKVIWLPR